MRPALRRTEVEYLVAETVPLRKQKHLFQVEVLEPDVGALEEPVSRRKVSIEPVIEDAILGNTLRTGTARKNGGVYFVVFHRPDYLRSYHLLDFEVYVGTASGKILYHPRQQIGRHGRYHAQPQHARHGSLEHGHVLIDRIEHLHDIPGPFGDHLSRLRQYDRFFRPVEQHHAELLLEVLYLHAQRRLSDETPFGRKRKAAEIHHRKQIFQLYNRHLRIYTESQKYKK